jgi:hypothetical protein
MMRKVLAAAAVAAVSMAFAAAPGMAFDKCYPALSAKGETEDSMREAMEEAKKAWHKAAEKKYDDDFDNWYYSGDRSIACKWDPKGTKFTCTATARPCGRDD